MSNTNHADYTTYIIYIAYENERNYNLTRWCVSYCTFSSFVSW